MVKFGKNKFKALNKIAKSQKLAASSQGISNKILKKKINADKKVTFQKEVLLKESVKGDNPLVNKKSVKEVILNELARKAEKKQKVTTSEQSVQKPKLKPVEKHKKRQQTQLNDTKLLLSLMKKHK